MSSKKGLGRGLGAIISLAPVREDGAARIDEAIRASAGPSVLALSGDSFEEIVRAGISGAPAAPVRRDAQPMGPPPGAGFAQPLDLRVGPANVSRTEAVAVPPPAAPEPIAPAPTSVAVLDTEEPAPAVAADDAPSTAEAPVDSDEMAAARRAQQYSLFDTPPAAVPTVPEPAAPSVPETTADDSVSAPVAADAPAFTDEILYFDDTILVNDVETAPAAVAASAPPAGAVAPAPSVAPPPVPAPAAFTDDVVLIDDVFIDDAIGGLVLPDVEME